MEMLYLQTPRMNWLRPTPADLPRIENLVRDRSLTDHPGVLPQGDRIAVVARGILARWQNRLYGTCLIELRETGELIGLGGIKDLEIEGEVFADLGFMFLKGYQRLGLGGEGGLAAIRKGFAAHGFSRIVANTSRDNKAALALLAKLGFTFAKEVDYEISGVWYRQSQMWELKRERYLKSMNLSTF